jgi:glutaredoxin
MSWNWFRRGERSKGPSPRQVLFYTRHGCHLCEEAWEVVTAAQKKHGFTLARIDIDTDPALTTAHGECVPVVAIDGKVRFRGRVNAVLLERMVRGG